MIGILLEILLHQTQHDSVKILTPSKNPPKCLGNSFFAQAVWGKSDLPQNRLNRFWHEADIDGNGVIDFQEFTESLGIFVWNDGVFFGTYTHLDSQMPYS